MSIKQNVSVEDNQVILTIEGRFDFSLHQSFRDSYKNQNIENCKFIIDLTNASYMDSSALGMILLLKDHAENLGGEVIIRKPNDSVYKILQIAQFSKLLIIEH